MRTKKPLSILLTICMIVGLVPWTALSARAEWTITVWDQDQTYAEDEKLDLVEVFGNVTLTISEGKTLTVDSIDAREGSLTVAGPGALVVRAAIESAVLGDLTVTGGAVELIGGEGMPGTDAPIIDDPEYPFPGEYISDGEPGYPGESAISGNLTVTGGVVTVTGGVGGRGGAGNNYGAKGDGGDGVTGSVTVSGGKLSIAGGSGSHVGRAVHGMVTASDGTVEVSEDGETYTTLTGGSSEAHYLRYVVSSKFAAVVGAVKYENFAQALAAWNDGTTLTLLHDVETDSAIEIESGKTVTLDLNGCAIDRGLANASAVEMGWVLCVKGNLTVNDSSATEQDPVGTGKITGGNNNRYEGGGVCIESNASFTLNGGSICGNKTGGDTNGAGVSIGTSSTFTMNGGAITDNAVTGSGSGGGVYNNGTFYMNGGTIKRNAIPAGTYDYGGGVRNEGLFYLSGSATITDNTRDGAANNLFAHGPTGPSDDYPIVTSALTGKIGVTVVKWDNAQHTYVPAVGLFAKADVNYNGGRLTAKDVSCLTGDNASYMVKLNGDGAAELYQPPAVAVIGETGYPAVQEALDAAKSGDEITLLADVTTDKPLAVASGTVEMPVTLDLNGFSILMTGSDNVLALEGDVALTLKDAAAVRPIHKLTMEDGRATAVETAAEAGPDSDTVRYVTGGCIAGGAGGGVFVGGGGTFTMESGTISGNSAAAGGGVFVSGTFTMTGGTISGNKAYRGGGVFVNDYSTFTMSGTAVIDGNRATQNGGGVFVNCDSEFNITGGTISGNEANAGGGVYVHEDGTFSMSAAAVIDGNSATGNGGGVYVGDDGTFSMSGEAAVTGNQAGGSGGGVYLIGYYDDYEEESCFVAAFRVSGGATVTGNTVGGAANNVWLDTAYNLVTVTGELAGAIGITVVRSAGENTYAPSTDAFAAADGTYNKGALSNGDVQRFTSDNDGYAVILNSEGKAGLITVVRVTSVTLNTDTLSLTCGGSQTLTATVMPADATNKTVAWSSDKASVATVDASGKVTAISVGTATITAAAGGKTATCVVTVKPKSVTPAVTLSASSYAYDGASKKPTATVKVGNTTLTNSDYTVAYQNNTDPGTATVTVTLKGSYTGTATATFQIYGVKGAWNGGKLTAKACAAEPANVLLIAAVYDGNGKQADVKVIELAANKTAYEAGVTAKTSGYTYKLMLVNKTTCAPLFAAWSEKA